MYRKTTLVSRASDVNCTHEDRASTMRSMRLLLMLVIGLGVGGLIYYYTLNQQADMGTSATKSTQSAQDAADAYKKNQADMMKQLEQ